MRSRFRPLLFAGMLFGFVPGLFAGFASMEQYLAAVGRVSGADGAEFYTTIWVTDLTSAPVSFTFEFLKAGQANASPASFTDNLAPGQTKVYENVVQSKLGLSGVLGGARVTSTGEILVAERIYDQAPGADLGDTEGLFFAGVPKSFSISLGQSASIQGINQGGSENFRYNFALLETGGGSPTVNVQLFDGNGTMLGQKAYPMQPYEQIQPNVKDLFAGVATTNGRITATVTGGTGSVIIAGAQLANVSQDSSGFEMSFRDQLLGGGTAGVTSLNGLTGALTIAHGANTTVNVNGSTITIDAVSGSGSGLTAVAHDNSLAGSGTVAVPLGIAPGGVGNAQLGAGAVTAPKIAAGQVVTSVNGLHDALTLAGAGTVSLSSSGNTITITGSGGGGGGLTLPYSSSYSTGTGFGVNNTANSGVSIWGSATPGNADGVYGSSAGTGTGVKGTSGNGIGVWGISAAGGSNTAVGVYGTNSNASGAGVGGANTSNGNLGFLGGPSYGVGAVNTHGGQAAVYGTSSSSSGYGVLGNNSGSGNNGYLGGVDYGVFGTTAIANKPGVLGTNTNAGGWGVEGDNPSSGTNGYLAGSTYGVYGSASGPATTYFGGIFDNGVHIRSSWLYAEGVGYSIYATGNVHATGNLDVAGNKNFVSPHPSDPSKQIVFTCLEGNESGTYFRGTARTVGGFATIEVPESFRLVTSENGLSAVATPVGDLAVLAIVSQDLQRIIVQSSRDVTFNYVVNGVRAGFEEHPTIVENTAFVPRFPADGQFANINPETRRRLVANGILNPDGSINAETARRLGWDKRPGWNAATQ